MEVYDTSRKQKALTILRRIPLFAGLDDKEFDHIYSICNIKAVDTDEFLFEEGSASRHLYVLINGKVEIATKKNGVIYVVKPGEVFGEIGMISQRNRTASAVARDKAVVIEIKREDFNLLLGKHPRVTAVLLKNITISLSDHIIRMNNRESLDYIHTRRRPAQRRSLFHRFTPEAILEEDD